MQKGEAGKRVFSLSKRIALVAVMSATLVGGKFALSFVPNIEIVTTLLVVYAYVFGWDAAAAALVFCTCDILLYPPSIDVILSYYIYWPLLALSACSLRRAGVQADAPYLVLALGFTAAFGVLTTFMSHLLLGLPFAATYVAGLVFYALHLVGTLVMMLAAFKPLTKVLMQLNDKYTARKESQSWQRTKNS